MNICAQALSRNKIRQLTYQLRKLIGTENTPYFPIPQFIEYILVGEEYFSLLILSEDEMKDTYGRTNTANNQMVIREDVYNGAVKGIPRHRFTLCHELGHYLLHQPSTISFARGEIPIYCQPEWQANTFAAELLAPYHLIKDMSVDQIAEQCGMSQQEAFIQHKICHR